MPKKEDARITKTKQKLYGTFLQMLSERVFEEITINEICAKAAVRRATFYKHFNDKHDFFAAMIADLIGRFDAKTVHGYYKSYPIEYHIAYVHRLISYLIECEDILKLIFKSNQAPYLISTMIRVNYNIIKERLEICVANGHAIVASVDTVTTMLSGGIGTMIVKWFESGRPTSDEEFIGEIEKMVYAVFKK